MIKRSRKYKRVTFSTKSQVQETMMYLLGIIIIGLILFLGTKYILKINKNVEEIDLLQFKTALESTAKRYSTKYGSWIEQDFTVSKEVKAVCFFDLAQAATAVETKLCGGSGKEGEQPEQTKNMILCDAWKSGSNSNVMTIPFVTDAPILIENMKVDTAAGYLCKKATVGKITVTIIGLGNGIKLS